MLPALEANIGEQARPARVPLACEQRGWTSRSVSRAAAVPLPSPPRPQFSGAAPYSLGSLQALLRLYLIVPEACKPALVSSCLQLALQRLPEDDFSLCLHMVPERVQADSEVAPLVTLGGHLDACRFKEYWAAAPARLAASVRAYAAHCLAQAYRSLPAALAAEALNLPEEGALATWVAAQPGWGMDKGAGLVLVPANAGNTPSSEAGSGGVPLAKILSLLAA